MLTAYMTFVNAMSSTNAGLAGRAGRSATAPGSTAGRVDTWRLSGQESTTMGD